MSNIVATIFVFLQRILPKSLITAAVYRIARIQSRVIKDFLIRKFVRLYKVDLDEVKLSVPDDFASFNAFFMRELAEGSRQVASAHDAIVSPVDGTVSAAGRIENDSLVQAKGINYSLADFLAIETHIAKDFSGGEFATIYLAPYNYHRVHAPLAGRLQSMHYVPGKLFSVNAATVARLPSLFVQNERLVCHIDTSSGPAILVFVGAMNVGSISTPWTDEIRPKKSGIVESIDLAASPLSRSFKKGDQLGWFNMGSTVVLLTPPGKSEGLKDLAHGQLVSVGQQIGTVFSAQ